MLDLLLTVLMAINIALGGTVGNIDIDNRAVVINPDGGFSTELSFSTEIDGYEVLLSQVINGKIVSEQEAIDHYLVTEEHLGKFSSWQLAEQYAKLLHCRQEQRYGQQLVSFFIFMEGGVQMEYTDYGVVWVDGIERCTDNPDEKEEQEKS